MRRNLLVVSTAIALSFAAVGIATSASRPRTKTVSAKKVARVAQVDSRIEIVAGADRVMSYVPGQSEDMAAPSENGFTTDAVDLACPEGLTAIGGGFRTPDDEVITLIGSSPSSGVAGAWRIRVSLQWPDHDAVWTPYVSCAR